MGWATLSPTVAPTVSPTPSPTFAPTAPPTRNVVPYILSTNGPFCKKQTPFLHDLVNYKEDHTATTDVEGCFQACKAHPDCLTFAVGTDADEKSVSNGRSGNGFAKDWCTLRK